MATAAVHRTIIVGESLGGCLEVTICAVRMVCLRNRTGCMAAQAGMVFNFQIFIMTHHLWVIIVIVALGAPDDPLFTLLNGGMALPAGGRLVILRYLLMTS